MDSLTIFILGGYSGHSDLDSDNFHLGGYSGTLGFGLSDNFHLGEGVVGEGGILQNRAILWDLDQNFNHSSRLVHHR